MAEIKLSPQAQQTLLQLQTFQQQLQSISIQKESLTIQNLEIEKALEELEKIKDKEDVFKAVGPILIKSTKKELTTDLKNKKDTVDLRLKTLEKQESRLREKLKDSQEKLQEYLKGSKSGTAE